MYRDNGKENGNYNIIEFLALGQGDLASRLITPTSHILTPVIPIITPFTEAP